MNSQFTPRPPAHTLRSLPLARELHGRQHAPMLERWLTPEQSNAAQRLLQQLFQSLTVLGCTSDLALTSRGLSAANQDLRAQLQPQARQAEAAMHELRELRIVTSPVLTELSQSLTVLVLAADMIGNGQLAGSEALSFYELLRRNTEVAMRALAELVKLFEFADR